MAFGSTFYGLDGATVASACLLALGIGIQNFPEGSAVALPLIREGMSRRKAFFYGQLSGIVEPISGVLGALLVIKIRTLLPFCCLLLLELWFMLLYQNWFQRVKLMKKDLMALFTIIGFAVMMLLDISL